MTKAPCYASTTTPVLWGTGTQVSVTNPQSKQEYIILNYKKDISKLTESDWAGSKTPSGSSLLLDGTANAVNYVYTRVKETDTSFAGTTVRMESIYLGDNASLQDISLRYQLLRGYSLNTETQRYGEK